MAKNITVYTTNTCAYCVMVKKYLDSKGQNYQTVNLDEHPEERQKVIELSGAQTVPVTVISNENDTPNITIGWNPGKLAAAIAA
jgi:glutaredoxin 3